MSLKYRVRLQNDRVIGPLSEQEIIELFEKDFINGTEMCQQFPIGEWQPLSNFSTIDSQIQNLAILKNERIAAEKQKNFENVAQKISEDESPVKESEFRQENTTSEIKHFNEFKFSQNAKLDVDYKELEKQHRIQNPKHNEDLDQDKTIVRKKKSFIDLDKTVVRPQKNEKKIETDKSLTNALNQHSKERPIVKIELTALELRSKQEISSEQTQFVDLHEILPKMNAQLKISEIEFEKQEKIEESEERFRQKIKKEEEIREKFALARGGGESDEEIAAKKKPKRMSWIVALAFIAVIYNLLYPDETPKKIGPVFINVNFPATKEYEDPIKSKEELGLARSFYAENSYIKRVIAAEHYQRSLEYKFNDNPAVGELLLNYSELFENAKNEKLAANIVYKLIKVSEKDLFKDVNTASGAAIFYGKIGKPNTGINTIKNYLRVGSKPSVKLLSIYLDLLISAGDLVEARKVFDKIKSTPKKPIEVYLPLARFLETDDKLGPAQETIEEGLKFYPKSAVLLLKEASFLMKAQSLIKYEETLNVLKQVEMERSPVYLSQYYYYLGMLRAFKNKNSEAETLFKKSLEIRESDELRTKLAELEVGGSEISQKIILESKIIALLKKAKEEIKNKNWDQATILSSEAIDANPNYVPAALVLADLQTMRGLFDAAIHTLIAVKEKNPNSNQILTKLIQTYLKAYKYEDAQRLLVEGTQSKYSQTAEYYYMYGLFFEGKGNPVLAAKYFDESLRRNPVDDTVMFKMANLFFKNKQFADSKKKLSEALILDPKNTEYLSLYAQIINEQDNSDTAIGYLRDIISENGEDPKLLSTITAIYYKTGQVNEFKTYYKKVQSLPKKDEGLYEFLISASKLNEAWDEFEQYSKEMIKINPGNLKARMSLAEHYIDKGKNQEAIDELMEIKERLPSYPKVHFMLAKVFLNQGDMKQAKIMADLELKLNPSLDSAYFIVGEVHRQNKNYREAVENFEKAISKNGKSIEAMTALAWIRLNQNIASEALDLYVRAVKLEPGNAEIHRQLGFTYKALGQRSTAREKFEDYLKLNPAAADKAQIDQLIRSLK